MGSSSAGNNILEGFGLPSTKHKGASISPIPRSKPRVSSPLLPPEDDDLLSSIIESHSNGTSPYSGNKPLPPDIEELIEDPYLDALVDKYKDAFLLPTMDDESTANISSSLGMTPSFVDDNTLITSASPPKSSSRGSGSASRGASVEVMDVDEDMDDMDLNIDLSDVGNMGMDSITSNTSKDDDDSFFSKSDDGREDEEMLDIGSSGERGRHHKRKNVRRVDNLKPGSFCFVLHLSFRWVFESCISSQISALLIFCD